MKKMLSKVKMLPLTLGVLATTTFPTLTFAATSSKPPASSSTGGTNPFSDSISSSDSSALYKDLGTVIKFVQAIGGFWVLVCIIFSGIMLAGSVNNPQKRTSGIVGLCCALGGAWIIMKASVIGGWVVALGSTTAGK